MAKEKTVSLRTHNKLKTQFRAMTVELNQERNRAAGLFEANLKISTELNSYRNQQDKAACGPLDELQVARTAINALNGLNPFARRVAVSTILKSLSEQAMHQLAGRTGRVNMAKQEVAAAEKLQHEASNECKDLAATIIASI